MSEDENKSARETTKHPDQPKMIGADGVVCFKANPIVKLLLDSGPFSLETISLMPWSDEDKAHFSQLLGYSVHSWGDLSYVDNKAANRHDDEAIALREAGIAG